MDPIVGLFVAGILGAVILYRRRPFIPDVPRQWRTSHAVAAGLCRRLHRAVDNADRAVKRAHDHGVAVTSLEGAPPKKRVAVQVWDSMEKLQAWRNSAEFKDVRKIGNKYATFRSFTVEGLPQ